MWSILLDVLFPPRPTERIVRECVASQKKLPRFTEHHHGVTTLLSYQEQTVHAAIVENKYYRNERAQRILSDILRAHVASSYITPIFLVPIPLSNERRRKRGYNQVEEVLKKIDHAEARLLPTLLIRTRNTAPQTSLNKIDRLKNMGDAFRVNQDTLKKLPTPCTVVVVDDVYTTGATLAAAHAALLAVVPPTTTLACVALAH